MEPNALPEWIIAGYPVLGMFIGYVLKELVKAPKLILPVNFVFGGICGLWVITNPEIHSLLQFIVGANMGLAATGLYQARKLVNGGGS